MAQNAGLTIEQAVQLAHDLHGAGRIAEANQVCRQVLAADPECAPALNLMGILLYGTGHGDASIELFTRAVTAGPGAAEYHGNLANVLRSAGRFDEAVAAYGRALELTPDLAAIHSNLGSCLAAKGDLNGAIASFRAALRLDPKLVEAHCNLANALLDEGRVDDATAAYRTAVAIAPGHPDAQWNLGTCLLLQGEFTRGWRGFEWRLRSAGARPRFTRPLWDGTDLAGRTILLHAEQGFGDTIQFIRYAKLVAARGGRVVVECQPTLIGLLRQLPEVAEWVACGEPLPAFDVHCPLLSLPGLFRTTLANLPPMDPPLSALAESVEPWRRRFDERAAGPKVGLAWAGNPGHANDHRRSIPLDQLAPLLAVRPDACLVSLQVGSAAAAVRPTMLDAGAELRDLADTAAVVAALDQVITVDTAVAHLAGSMGKPTWLLLPSSPDWRWLLGRTDSPWYPSMRLFRQERPGDWAGVIGTVAAELQRSARIVEPGPPDRR